MGGRVGFVPSPPGPPPPRKEPKMTYIPTLAAVLALDTAALAYAVRWCRRRRLADRGAR